MSKALITGILGQDGAYLTKILYEKGYEVIGIARKPAGFPNLEYLNVRPPTMYYGDVAEASFINKVISDIRPDEIYNMAAQSHVGQSFLNPITTMNVNYGGLVNIINAVKKYTHKTKIYQAGTSEMYGYSSMGQKLNEETPFKPMSPYAISKVAAHWAGVNARAEGIWVSNGILFNHESPIRGENFVTRKITKALAEKKPLSLGNYMSERDWGFAGDYVEGMFKMLQHEKPDDFVLATGETHSVLEFLKAAGDLCGHTMASGVDRECERPNDLNYLCGDASKAKEVLDWEPRVKFKELVHMMVKEDMNRYGKI